MAATGSAAISLKSPTSLSMAIPVASLVLTIVVVTRSRESPATLPEDTNWLSVDAALPVVESAAMPARAAISASCPDVLPT